MKLKLRTRTVLAAAALAGLALPGAVPAAHATTYAYTGTVTLSHTSRPAGQSLGVTATFTLGSNPPHSWPTSYDYRTTTDYEIVLCPDLPGGTGLEGFNCYAVSDIGEPLPDGVVAGQRLQDSSGNTQWSYSTISSGVTVTLPPQRPLAIEQNSGKARISVQSVKRYGEDGNVCVAGTPTGVGVDPGLIPPTGPGQCPPGTVSSGDAMCQPFCYKYNDTPRLVAEKAFTLT